MDKKKLLIIIGIVLFTISIGLSSLSLFMVTKALNSVNGKEEVEEESEETQRIPISQLTTYVMSNKTLVILSSKDEPKDKLSFSIKVGFSLDSKNKASDSILEELSAKEDFINAKISTLVSKKYKEDILNSNSRENLSGEILAMMQEEFQTDAIVEVYFPEFLYN